MVVGRKEVELFSSNVIIVFLVVFFRQVILGFLGIHLLFHSML